jgi:hypothetical protein
MTVYNPWLALIYVGMLAVAYLYFHFFVKPENNLK